MKLLLVTDAWFPQVNGVVRTLSTVCRELESRGHRIAKVTPDQFRTIPCPTYPEIRLALRPAPRLERWIEEFGPDRIHVATEGPLGMAARRWCSRNGVPFTSAFHTRFSEAIHARFRIPMRWTYRGLRWFHSAAVRTMVSTPSLRAELAQRGFRNVVAWSRGVDTELFRPREKAFLDLPRPIHLCVGRVAIEKNLEAFLRLPLRGTKLVVGDGPDLPRLRKKFPEAVFAGMQSGVELARFYAASDVFVFPSRTDTFGLVLLEALASGLPVAAHPVTGPLDVVTSSEVGALDEDLSSAIARARQLDPRACRRFALRFSWERCADQFASHLEPIRAAPVPALSAAG